MTTPLPPKRKAAREGRALWAIVRDGCPVSMSASSIGPSHCWQNWHARSCVTVLEMPGDRIVKYLPAPRAGKAKGGAR